MFERFTNRARHTVVLAQEEARQLHHNYIGTEHVLLGLLGEPEGYAGRILASFGITRDGAREEVRAMVGTGTDAPSGHIPFTPRAKKTLELALREALQLHHNYIGTEHILLGLIREGDGVAAQIMKQHADLLGDPHGRARHGARGEVRGRQGPPLAAAPPFRGRSARGRAPSRLGQTELRTTPAADTSLSEAARLAGAQPVGSHHLLLAALADDNTAAAKALAALGVNLDQAKEALRSADVIGTSDEQPEEAGRRQMLIHVTDDKLTIEASDPVIVKAGLAALRAVAGAADPAGTIRGDLPVSASLSNVWQALEDSLGVIERRATLPAESAQGGPDKPGTETA